MSEQLVPREPTQEMIFAFIRTTSVKMPPSAWARFAADFPAAWQAALDAAPRSA
jgi:hypothetical protein